MLDELYDEGAIKRRKCLMGWIHNRLNDAQEKNGHGIRGENITYYRRRHTITVLDVVSV